MPPLRRLILSLVTFYCSVTLVVKLYTKHGCSDVYVLLRMGILQTMYAKMLQSRGFRSDYELMKLNPVWRNKFSFSNFGSNNFKVDWLINILQGFGIFPCYKYVLRKLWDGTTVLYNFYCFEEGVTEKVCTEDTRRLHREQFSNYFSIHFFCSAAAFSSSAVPWEQKNSIFAQSFIS